MNKNTARLLSIFIIMLVLMTASITLHMSPIAEEEKETHSENITMTLNPDGTLGISGIIKYLRAGNNTAPGKAEIEIFANPIYKVQNISKLEVLFKADGTLRLKEKPANLTYLKIELDVTQKGGTGRASVNFEIIGNNTSGNGSVEFKTTTENYTQTTAISFNINLKHPIDNETVGYMKKQLQQMRPEIMNLALAQYGLTFMKIEKMDLSHLTIDTNGVRGTGSVVLSFNINDYINWVKGSMYAQGKSDEEINKTAETLSKLFTAQLNPENKGDLELKITFENNVLEFHALYNASMTGDLITALSEYFGMMPSMIREELHKENIPMVNITEETMPTNITLAPKKFDIKMYYSGSENEQNITVIINNLYLRKEGTTGYNGALETLHKLSESGKNVEEISHLKIIAQPYNGKTPTIYVTGNIEGNILSQTDNTIEMENVKLSSLKNIELKNVPQVTQTSQTVVQTKMTGTSTTATFLTTTEYASGIIRIEEIGIAIIVIAIIALAIKRLAAKT
jgi:biopolymer transport protein ExbD